MVEELAKLARGRLGPNVQVLLWDAVGMYSALVIAAVSAMMKAVRPDDKETRLKSLVESILLTILVSMPPMAYYKDTEYGAMMALIFYVGISIMSKQQNGGAITEKNARKLAEEFGIPVLYDPVTPFTFVNLEWDRLLKVRRLLYGERLVLALDKKSAE